MATAEVYPNSEFFKKLHASRKLGAVLRQLRVHRHTRDKLLNGEPVRGSTIQKIARRLGVAIGALIVPPAHLLLSTDPQFYESLRFEYFTDNDWLRDGEAKWWRGEVELHAERARKPSGQGWRFNGTLRSTRGTVFNVEAQLTNARLFTLTATQRAEDAPSETLLGFQGVFRRQHGEVVCGIWCGMDPFEAKMCVCRIFLASEPLSESQILQLTEELPIALSLEDVVSFGDSER